ncbi:hypothetical protein DFH09DRAFT_1100346 [Mycena vulgaris]|nr:hypothetical protein DFH09DRAFT_1100346 [Mycena vulgaris]
MDPGSNRRFIASNVGWPMDKFFIPAGGMEVFLLQNLRFKVFLVMQAVFLDGYAASTAASFKDTQHSVLRIRIREIFFAAQIRQNEYRADPRPVEIPSDSAWMFCIIITLLQVIGFAGQEVLIESPDASQRNAQCEGDMKAGIPSKLDYGDCDPKGAISNYFSRRCEPSDLALILVADHSDENNELEELFRGWWKREDVKIEDGPLPSTTGAPEAVGAAEALDISTTLDTIRDEPVVIKREDCFRSNLPSIRRPVFPSCRSSSSSSSNRSSASIPLRENKQFIIVPKVRRLRRSDSSGSMPDMESIGASLGNELAFGLLVPSTSVLADSSWEGEFETFFRCIIHTAVYILQRSACDNRGRKGPLPPIGLSERIEFHQHLGLLMSTLISCALYRSFAGLHSSTVSDLNSILADYPIPSRVLRGLEILDFLYGAVPLIGTELDDLFGRISLHLRRAVRIFIRTARTAVAASGEPSEFAEYAPDGYRADGKKANMDGDILVLFHEAAQLRRNRGSDHLKIGGAFEFRSPVHKSQVVCCPVVDTTMAPRSRLHVELVRSNVYALLLTSKELMNPDWEPTIPVPNFLRDRVRPCVYLLQRVVCDEGGWNGPAPQVPFVECEELRWLVRITLGTIRHLGRSRFRAVERLPTGSGPAPSSIE